MPILRPESLLALVVAIPFVLAAAALLIGSGAGGRAGWLMVAAAAASFLGCITLVPAAWEGASVVLAAQWMPAIGVTFALRADAFGLMFALLISGIGTLIGVYSMSYMPAVCAPARLVRYYAALLAFMGAMLGVALADDLILLFVFWEITSLTSFLLIGFWDEHEEARNGAMTALQITALGGMVMMAGIVLVGITCGTFSLRALAQDPAVRDTLAASPAFAPALLLLLAGALTKSAQWPFHFWLPGAMVAPTPISTYLHAATMVQAGVFLMGRLLPIFSASPLWFAILVPLGLGTFLTGAIGALRVSDLKAMLARTTVASLGLFTFGYGVGANAQDALQILSHAAYKGALFLVAGIIEHATHTRDLRRLGGLRARMPITFAICVVAASAMAGIWPSLGFHAKELTYHGLLQLYAVEPLLRWTMLALVVAGNACLVAVALTLVVKPFFGPLGAEAAHAHEAGPGLWLPPAVLAAATLAFGAMPEVTGRMVSAFSSRPGAAVHLSLAASGPELLLTLLTTTAGVGLFLLRKAIAAPAPSRLTMQRLWDGAIEATTRAATAFSGRWQNGSVHWYFSGTLVFTVGLAAYALAHHGISPRMVSIDLHELQWYGASLCMMLAVSAVMVVRFNTRVAAAIALTTNGFLTALLFVVYRSPDILLTQILIETVSTIFILLIFYFMPAFKPEKTPAIRRTANLTISVAVGAAMFAFVMLSTSPQFRETNNLGLEYLSRSLADAGGANAVNVIIVDFRAIDTNGEITVLMMVALVVFGLLRARRAGPRPAVSPPDPVVVHGDSPILRTAARFAVPLTAWVSIVIFMQGHNLPGGGFIAGVMGAAAGAMTMLAFGLGAAVRVPWWKVSVLGLLASVGTGMVPFVLGRSYMDHEILHFHLPMIGLYELPTATFFDLGVYMIVLGTIMTMFVELGQEGS